MNNCTRGEGYGPHPTATWCPYCQEYTNHTSAGCPTCGVDGSSRSTVAREAIQRKRTNRKLSLENVILRQALKICNECAHSFYTGDAMTAILAKRIADVSEEALRQGGGEDE